MTTAAPIDVEVSETAVLIDLENIRLSWERLYNRVFRYTDLCWLCELVEQRFQTEIGRVAVFMSDPKECEGTVAPEQLQELKKMLRYLREDEEITRRRNIVSQDSGTFLNRPHSLNNYVKNRRHTQESSVEASANNSVHNAIHILEDSSMYSAASDASSKNAQECYPSDMTKRQLKQRTSFSLQSAKSFIDDPILLRTNNLKSSTIPVCKRNNSVISVVDIDDSDSDADDNEVSDDFTTHSKDQSFTTFSLLQDDNKNSRNRSNRHPLVVSPGALSGSDSCSDDGILKGGMESQSESCLSTSSGHLGDNEIDLEGSCTTISTTRNLLTRQLAHMTEPNKVHATRHKPPIEDSRSSHPGSVVSSHSDSVVSDDTSINSSDMDDSDGLFARLGSSACSKCEVVVKVFGYKMSGRRRVQRCCDVAIGNEVTKICFMARYSSIFLFSADSDFEETAKSCAEAENLGGVIKYAKQICILGFSFAFESSTASQARQQFRKRRDSRLLHRRNGSNKYSLSINQHESKENESPSGGVGVYLIDYEFPVIRRILNHSKRPLLSSNNNHHTNRLGRYPPMLNNKQWRMKSSTLFHNQTPSLLHRSLHHANDYSNELDQTTVSYTSNTPVQPSLQHGQPIQDWEKQKNLNMSGSDTLTPLVITSTDNSYQLKNSQSTTHHPPPPPPPAHHLEYPVSQDSTTNPTSYGVSPSNFVNPSHPYNSSSFYDNGQTVIPYPNSDGLIKKKRVSHQSIISSSHPYQVSNIFIPPPLPDLSQYPVVIDSHTTTNSSNHPLNYVKHRRVNIPSVNISSDSDLGSESSPSSCGDSFQFSNVIQTNQPTISNPSHSILGSDPSINKSHLIDSFTPNPSPYFTAFPPHISEQRVLSSSSSSVTNNFSHTSSSPWRREEKKRFEIQKEASVKKVCHPNPTTSTVVFQQSHYPSHPYASLPLIEQSLATHTMQNILPSITTFLPQQNNGPAGLVDTLSEISSEDEENGTSLSKVFSSDKLSRPIIGRRLRKNSGPSPSVKVRRVVEGNIRRHKEFRSSLPLDRLPRKKRINHLNI